MGKHVNTLLSLKTDRLSYKAPYIPAGLAAYAPELSKDLLATLWQENGFFDPVHALHLFPAGSVSLQSGGYDLASWNRGDLWRQEYGPDGQGFLFFAEDVFGEQFAMKKDRIYRFDPETAAATEIAEDLEGWAATLIANYNVETGYPLAYEWQQRHGPLQPWKRLVPIIPFALGGEYKLDNLHAIDAVEGMRFRADIWKQCRHLPAGTKVRLQIDDAEK